ncbi:hypothetical protein [Comamonas thiooxydans]|uniref:hypothetical protein n=1 Tax=Comamonas thiooxydans TaxID=363952 RepID=UPI0006A9379B|nr:hypothetical protein [Comamonas thiooxydans]CUA97780.1 hypothetical protein Ga0061062_106176 [Comamonas thiooxydans]
MNKATRPMLEIPVSAAKDIADRYGYDQVVIIARRVGDEPEPRGEHVTTYGRDKAHCGVAARVGNFIKHKIMGWPEYEPAPQAQAEAREAVTQAVRDYYFALDTRQHGGAAASKALDAIQKALGVNWVQGAEASARASMATSKGE